MPSINGLPYPALSDPNNPPADFLALATAVDARFPVSIDRGGTGATTLAAARASLGIKVLDVRHASFDSIQTFPTTNTTWGDVTDLSITLTPKSASSKFLIEANVWMVNNSATSSFSLNAVRVLKDGTNIGSGLTNYTASANNSTIAPYTVRLLNSPATTSSITYKVQAQQSASASSYSVFINRVLADNFWQHSSYLTIYELAS